MKQKVEALEKLRVEDESKNKKIRESDKAHKDLEAKFKESQRLEKELDEKEKSLVSAKSPRRWFRRLDERRRCGCLDILILMRLEHCLSLMFHV